MDKTFPALPGSSSTEAALVGQDVVDVASAVVHYQLRFQLDVNKFSFSS